MTKTYKKKPCKICGCSLWTEKTFNNLIVRNYKGNEAFSSIICKNCLYQKNARQHRICPVCNSVDTIVKQDLFMGQDILVCKDCNKVIDEDFEI